MVHEAGGAVVPRRLVVMACECVGKASNQKYKLESCTGWFNHVMTRGDNHTTLMLHFYTVFGGITGRNTLE